MVALDQADVTGNYTVLRDISAPGFRDKNSAADLARIFAPIRDAKIDLSQAVLLDPHISKATVNEQKMLYVVGAFDTKPLPVSFELLFEPAGGRWRIFGISVTPIGQVERCPDASDAVAKSRREIAAAQGQPRRRAESDRSSERPASRKSKIGIRAAASTDSRCSACWRARPCDSHPGADRTQQKCRQMRVIGGLRGRSRGAAGRLGAADGGRARWRGRDRRGERGGQPQPAAGSCCGRRHRSGGVRARDAGLPAFAASLRGAYAFAGRAEIRFTIAVPASRLAHMLAVTDRRLGGFRWLAAASTPSARGMVWPISFSIAAIDLKSSGLTMVMAVPARPARPVRPMRWT